MAIKFIKNAHFDPKDVKDITFDVDENWIFKDLNFMSWKRERDIEVTDYSFVLLHKNTNQESKKIRITINNYHTAGYQQNKYMEIHIRPIDEQYGYRYSRTRHPQRNIYILLRNEVKDLEFIKSVFSMRRRTQREMYKLFGKIFKRRE